MFRECSSLTSLDVSNFNTSNVIDMGCMFNVCSSLTSLDLSHFNTSNVTDMAGMFDRCSSLTSLNVSNFNTSKVTTMSSMFRACSSLTSLDLSHFNTSKVTNMKFMFYGCSKLTSLNVSNWNTSNVTDMNSMFISCESLAKLDLSTFDMSNVIDRYGMLYYTYGLQIIITPYSTSTRSIDLRSDYYLFKNGELQSELAYRKISNDTSVCNPVSMASASGSGLELRKGYTITYKDQGNNTYSGSNEEELPQMHYYGYATTLVDGVKTGYAFGGWFTTSDCTGSAIETLGATDYTENITLYAKWTAETYTITYDANGGDDVPEQTYTIETNITLAGVPTREGYSFEGWLLETSTEYWEAKTYTANENVGTGKCGDITLVAQWSKDEYTLSRTWFNNISETITERGLIKTINFITSADIPTDYSGKIAVGETELDLIYLSYKETDGMYDVVIWSSQTIYAPQDSSYLFSDEDETKCFNNLTNITFDNFNTSKVTNMSSMFLSCVALQTLDISLFDISQVTTFAYFCNYCVNLENVLMPETYNNVATSINVMFAACYKLKSLDLSMFDLCMLTKHPTAVLSFNESLETIIAPYSTGEIELSIGLPAQYYIAGNASVLYSTMTNTNSTFSKFEGFDVAKTILKKVGVNTVIEINTINMDEDLLITLTHEDINNVNKMIDICTDSAVLKSGRWKILSDFDLDLAMLKEMFDQINVNFKVEVIQESTEFILVISELK